MPGPPGRGARGSRGGAPDTRPGVPPLSQRGQEGPRAGLPSPGSAREGGPGCWQVTQNRGAGTAPRLRSTTVGPAVAELAAPGGRGVAGTVVGSPGLPGPSNLPPAASGAGHGGSLPSHPRLTPGCCGAATHLPSQRWGGQREGGRGDARGVRGQRVPPGRGRESTTVPVPCRSCLCSPRWVPRLGGTGPLGRMPLPNYGFGHRGASRPPCSVPPGAVPTDRPWKGWECWWAASWAGASRVPRPHRTPAASLGCTNTITAQETEGRDCSPHSAFARQYLSAAAGFGTAGIGNIDP